MGDRRSKVVAKKQDAEYGNDGRSHLISFWSETQNIGVLSSTDKQFIDALKGWAAANGYRVEEVK